MLFLLATTILPLLFLLQSFTTVLFVRNAIVNIVLLISLLLQDLWTATHYLYINLTTSTTAHSLRDYVLQILAITKQSLCGMATRLFKAVYSGALKAIWSIWDLQDRVRSRILPAPNRNQTTLSTPSDSSSMVLVRCMGYTDDGQCKNAKQVVGGGIWYCFRHKRQDTRAHV